MSQANLQTLSEHLGVSASTISRILSGKARQYRISRRTEEKVLRAIDDLGFRPNYLAHSLNTGRTFTIGLVFANRVDEYLGNIMEGVESHLRETEYQMVLATCENDPEIERQEIERMLYRQVDGIIIYPSAGPRQTPYPVDHLRPPDGHGTPFVVIGRRVPLPVDHVLFRDEEAGRLAARRFLEAGCQRFGMVSQPVACSANDGRVRGCVDALAENGVPADRIHVIEWPAADSQLDTLLDVDAILGVNTSLLLHTLSALAARRETTSLLLESFGEMELFGGQPPGLHMWRMPSHQMGEEAARLLLQRMVDPAGAPVELAVPWP